MSQVPQKVFPYREEMKSAFRVLKANNIRNRVSMTVVFLTIVQRGKRELEVKQKITQMLEKRLRESDVAFLIDTPNIWCIFMSQSGEAEATPFLLYLFEDAKKQKDLNSVGIAACVMEIKNRQVSFDEMLQAGKEGIAESASIGAWNIEFLSSFKKNDGEEIKVSVLEPDEVVSRVIEQSLEQLSLDSFQLHIRSFKDGFEFLQSDWYVSSHFHLIVLNDILPRKNGLDVLHTIRKLPNDQKFYIFLMTKSKSEDAIIYSLESGVDDYIEKPFNIRLFEAKVRRVLNRLWQ